MVQTTLIQLLLTAILVEAVITGLKPLWDKGTDWELNRLVPIPIAILVAVAGNIDLFSLVGIEMTIPYVGAVLTGVIVSRGSNAVFDLIKLLEGVRGALKT